MEKFKLKMDGCLYGIWALPFPPKDGGLITGIMTEGGEQYAGSVYADKVESLDKEDAEEDSFSIWFRFWNIENGEEHEEYLLVGEKELVEVKKKLREFFYRRARQ